MKKRIVVLYNKILHYRTPIFNILAEKYDLTLVYAEPAKERDLAQCNFKTILIPVKKFCKLYFQNNRKIRAVCKDADIVVAYGQETFVNYTRLAFIRNSFGLVYWTIGAPASYNRHFGEASPFYYKVSDMIGKRADALVLYSDKAKDMYISRGFDINTLFVANNTVKVERINLEYESKQFLLFIGTFYLEKGLENLLEAYKTANAINPNIPVLKMVGGGDQLPVVRDWINSQGLSNKIELTGPIYDSIQKKELFKSAIACISPKQAGLSVLESMGYGVPFITEINAITGGEAFNIQSGVNGILMDDLSELKDIILDISNHRDKYLKMGEEAYKYYWKYRTPEIMAKGVEDAIEYVLAKRNL